MLKLEKKMSEAKGTSIYVYIVDSNRSLTLLGNFTSERFVSESIGIGRPTVHKYLMSGNIYYTKNPLKIVAKAFIFSSLKLFDDAVSKAILTHDNINSIVISKK